MTLPRTLFLRAQWRQRNESAEQISERMWALLTALEAQGGVLAEPIYSLDDPSMSISDNRDMVDSFIADGRDFDGPNGSINEMSGIRVAALQRPLEGPDVPRVHISVRAGATVGGRGGSVANTALVKIFPSQADETFGPIPEVLAHGAELVERMVSIWEPDFVSLDSRELLEAQTVWDATVPIIGFTTWLANDVVARDLSRVDAYENRRVEGGGLLSVDLSTDHVLEDGLEIVGRVIGSGLVKSLPLDYRT